MRSVRTERLYLNYQFIVQFIISFKIAQDRRIRVYGKDDAFAEIEMKEELEWLGGSWRFSADGGLKPWTKGAWTSTIEIQKVHSRQMAIHTDGVRDLSSVNVNV